jgi:hypothetical protein
MYFIFQIKLFNCIPQIVIIAQRKCTSFSHLPIDTIAVDEIRVTISIIETLKR